VNFVIYKFTTIGETPIVKISEIKVLVVCYVNKKYCKKKKNKKKIK